jgi:hypothetical protein
VWRVAGGCPSRGTQRAAREQRVITEDTFTELLLLAVGSTMPSMPMVAPLLARLRIDGPRPD